MSLKEELEAKNAEVEKNVPPELFSQMRSSVDDLRDSGLSAQAPKKGEALLGFSLPNQHGNIITLASLLEKGPLVINFYRGRWCPYCSIELSAYQSILADINRLGATFIAISPELPDDSLTDSEKATMDFDVLTDKNLSYARSLHLTFTVPENIRGIYSDFGFNLEDKNGVGQHDLPMPVTIVVGQDGVVIDCFCDEDYTKRKEPSEVLELLKAI